jgi:hypothetical protein
MSGRLALNGTRTGGANTGPAASDSRGNEPRLQIQPASPHYQWP